MHRPTCELAQSLRYTRIICTSGVEVFFDLVEHVALQQVAVIADTQYVVLKNKEND